MNWQITVVACVVILAIAAVFIAALMAD